MVLRRLLRCPTLVAPDSLKVTPTASCHLVCAQDGKGRSLINSRVKLMTKELTSTNLRGLNNVGVTSASQSDVALDLLCSCIPSE